MNVLTLDGKDINWVIKSKNKRKKSILQNEFLSLFKEIYDISILEEVPIPVFFGKTLFLDFYIPIFKCGIEINGQQHHKYSPHFHKNKYNFYVKQVNNDNLKREWCELNNIILLELDYKEKNEWRKILREKFGSTE